MATPERQPCPYRILDDLGGSFAVGAVGGYAFHYTKGFYNSSYGQLFKDSATAARMNAPRLGGSCAAWGGLFSACDCTMVYIRKKEDPWNSIIAGALTGGLLSMRQGYRSMGRAALLGGCLLALIEGTRNMVRVPS